MDFDGIEIFIIDVVCLMIKFRNVTHKTSWKLLSPLVFVLGNRLQLVHCNAERSRERSIQTGSDG